MRTIKFRAWDKQRKRMMSVGCIVFPLHNEASRVYPKRNKENEITDYELMQFTGLLDKNGIEIYEGDLVAYRNRGNKPIGFLKGGFVLLNEYGEFYDSVCAAHGECEVIGNIYEIPNLQSSN